MDFRGQAPVVQKLESVIHWINLYPVDTGVENDIFFVWNGVMIWITGYTPPPRISRSTSPPPIPPGQLLWLSRIYSINSTNDMFI